MSQQTLKKDVNSDTNNIVNPWWIKSRGQQDNNSEASGLNPSEINLNSTKNGWNKPINTTPQVDEQKDTLLNKIRSSSRVQKHQHWVCFHLVKQYILIALQLFPRHPGEFKKRKIKFPIVKLTRPREHQLIQIGKTTYPSPNLQGNGIRESRGWERERWIHQGILLEIWKI